MATIRAFIAIELAQEMQRGLTAIQARLKREAGSSVRWVRPESIHLTLKFLGDIDTAKVDAIAGVMTQAAQGVPPFAIGLGEAGGFPNVSRPRVVWVGLTGALEPLAALQRSLEQRLTALGFAPENRGFTPHLTLGRVRDPRPMPGLAKAAGPSTDPAPTQQVEEISLIQSTLRPEGAIYTRLRSARLGSVLPQ